MNKHNLSLIDVILLMVSAMALAAPKYIDTFPKTFIYTVVGIGITTRIVYLIINRKKH